MDGSTHRIAFLIHDLRGGGAERVTVSLASGIAKQGIQVDLVMINETGRSAYFNSIDSAVRVKSLNQNRTLTSIIGFRDYFNENRPDAVISAMTHINVAAILARKMARHRPRLIVVEHNQMSRDILGKRGFVRVAYMGVPWIYRHADLIGVVSGGVKDDLVNATGIEADRIEVLHNPVVTPLLRRQSRVPPDHPWLQPGEPPVILGVGRLTKQKNFGMLIDSFAALRTTRKARLMILGQGPEKKQLEDRCKVSGYQDDIALLGFVDNPFAYMRHAGALGLCSNWEGLPTVLIEAMACGTPVVSTNCPSGPSEILEGGALAPLTPPGDRRAFTEALHAVLDRRVSTEALVARAEQFSLEAAVDRYLHGAFPSDPLMRRNQLHASKSA